METGHTTQFLLKKLVQGALVSTPLVKMFLVNCRCSIFTIRLRIRLRTASISSKQEKRKLKCLLTTRKKKTLLAKVELRCQTPTLSLGARARGQLSLRYSRLKCKRPNKPGWREKAWVTSSSSSNCRCIDKISRRWWFSMGSIPQQRVASRVWTTATCSGTCPRPRSWPKIWKFNQVISLKISVWHLDWDIRGILSN
jgi:hypothetical protein